MTFCKQLAKATKDGYEIEAYENTDKFESVPYYDITISKDGIVCDVIKTAKTTWKRKFKELISD